MERIPRHPSDGGRTTCTFPEITSEILDGCRQSRPEAFDVLAACCEKSATHYASIKRIRDDQTLDELIRDVLVESYAFVSGHLDANPESVSKAIRRIANRLAKREKRHAQRELPETSLHSVLRESGNADDLGFLSGIPSRDPLPSDVAAFRELGKMVLALWLDSMNRLEARHHRYAKICWKIWRMGTASDRPLSVSEDAWLRANGSLRAAMIDVCTERLQALAPGHDGEFYTKLRESLADESVGTREFTRILEQLLAVIEMYADSTFRGES